jgi:hypothetical protein
MRACRTVVAVLVALLALPAAALATGFGPTTTPLSQSPPTADNGPLSVVVKDSNTLTVSRLTPTFYTVDVDVLRGNLDTNNLHFTGNPRGDGLVTWTENAGAHHVAGALFWPVSASAPNQPHELLDGGSTATRPFGVLDPSGSATVLWSQGPSLWQITTQDASVADPWQAAPTDLGGGGGFGASLPDGRAVYGYLKGVPFGGGGTGYQAWATTRTPGHAYRPPALLQDVGSGAGARFASDIFPANVVGISPAGRALVGYITTLNGDNGQCDPYDRQVVAALTTVSEGNDPPSFTQQVVSDHADGADPSMLSWMRRRTRASRSAPTIGSRWPGGRPTRGASSIRTVRFATGPPTRPPVRLG